MPPHPAGRRAHRALDSKNALAIFSLLQALARRDVLVVIASHDPRCRDYATRWIEMLDGAVVLDSAAS